jgi:hypothetical protein
MLLPAFTATVFSSKSGWFISTPLLRDSLGKGCFSSLGASRALAEVAEGCAFVLQDVERAA